MKQESTIYHTSPISKPDSVSIGYDAKRAFLNNTGLGNYSRWVISNVSKYYPSNRYYLFTPKTRPNNHYNLLKEYSNIQIIEPLQKAFRSLWRSKTIVKDIIANGVELYHGLSGELPIGISKRGIKTIVTVHDLIFLQFPKQFGWLNAQIYSFKVRHACNIADKIIAISEQTKNDLIYLLGIDKQKIEVIYQGCDRAFGTPVTSKQKDEVRKKYALPAQFLLSVGTIEERKNQLLIVKSLLLNNIDIPLVIVGKPTAYFYTLKEYIHQNNLADRVIFLHNVPFDDLPAIYQQSSIFIYPSRYEGFGIPILEALTCGVPTIGATGSCLEEAGGSFSLYVNPDDASGLAQNIDRVLTDTALAATMVAEGLKHTQNFTDEKLTAQLMALYQKTMNNA